MKNQMRFVSNALMLIMLFLMLMAFAKAQDPGYYFYKYLGKQQPMSRVTAVPPVEFEYNASSMQAFYFVQYTVDFEPVMNEDWFGAFNGDVCVGSRIWMGDWSDIPAMGDEGEDYSEGYLNVGDYPSFQFYDASEDTFYELNPAEGVTICPWAYNGFCTVSFELGDPIGGPPPGPDPEGFLYPLLYNADGEPVWFLKLFTE